MRTLHSLAFLALLASPAAAQQLRDPEPTGLQWRKAFDGPQRPTDLRQAPGDDTRFFVGSAREGIYIIKNGTLLPRKFLDLSSVLHSVQGFSSLAFHPDYENNGRFYVTYQSSDLSTHLVEYTVSNDPDVADAGSANPILTPDQGVSHLHNWNQLHFGGDGMLYAAFGDDNTGLNLSQDLNSIQGKILRLDVDAPPRYIPTDNPFFDRRGRGEIWHYGLRQPWKFCIDPQTQDMFIADVGRNDREELNFAPSGASGLNFGWRCMEGTQCNNFGPICNQVCDDPSWEVPILEYGHEDERCAIIGGYVYRGSIPDLDGAYFYGDYCTTRMWSLRYDGLNMTELQERTDIPRTGGTLLAIATFGVDNAGELYAADYTDGEIYKLEQVP